MRLWIISELYYPDETATGYLLTKIAEGLAKHHSVHIICVRISETGKPAGQSFYEERGGVHIHRSRSIRLDKNILPYRIINMVSSTLAIFMKSLRHIAKGDRVLVVTNPPPLPFALQLVCTLRSATCNLLIHDVYPDVLVASGILRRSSMLTSLANWMSKRLYANVDAIVVLGRDMYRLVSSKLSAGGIPITIIPNWADVDIVYPLPNHDNPHLKIFGLQNKFVIQYAGNMGRTHGLENIMQCAIRLREEHDVHFLLIGDGARRKSIEQMCAQQAMKNVSLEKSLPREEQLTFLNACDIGIVSFVKGMAGISVPSRMYNIMAAGKPIIAVADDDSELGRVVREEAIGWVVEPERPDLLENAIREAKSNPTLLSEMGKRARSAAEQKYPFEKILSLYSKLIFEGSVQLIPEP